MPAGTQPIVYISYRWLDAIDEDGRPDREPDPRARDLADKLRAHGFDVRFDLYPLYGLHGFAPPQPVAGNPQDPWFIWSQQQIVEADAVLMYCTADYVGTDPERGARWFMVELVSAG
jgi:hypothetical protein